MILFYFEAFQCKQTLKMLFLLDSYSARVREEKVARLLRARMRLQHAARIRRASCDKGVQTELEDPKVSIARELVK